MCSIHHLGINVCDMSASLSHFFCEMSVIHIANVLLFVLLHMMKEPFLSKKFFLTLL